MNETRVPIKRVEREGNQLVTYTDYLVFDADGRFKWLEHEPSSASVLAD